MGPDSNGCTAESINPYADPKLTLGKRLDLDIKLARENVETLCIKKAKAEAAGLLDYPDSFIRSLGNYNPF